MTIGYLGPEGSYSRIAADKFRPEAKKRGYPSFFALFSALKAGECDMIAVPIENSLNGGVLQNIDLLQETEGVFASEECTVKIDHRLAVRKGAPLAGIKRIYSHPQALAQCGEYLQTAFPSAELVAAPSTAAGLALVSSETEGAIVGAHTRAEGFELSAANIADCKENYTHFLLVKRGAPDVSAHSSRIFLSATCRHRPGELLNLLSPIRDFGLNMTKIESRPIKDRPGEYRFFIELEGDIGSENASLALRKMEETAFSIKLLGAYL